MTARSSCSATPRIPRISRSGRGPSSRSRMRSSSPRCSTSPGRPLGEALAEYQAERSLEVLKLQNSARNSTEWFEAVERYLDFEPWQFAYSLLTRSQRISHENLRLRDGDWLGQTERRFLAARDRRGQVRAADVRAVQAARDGARQSHRRLADGDLFGGRRDAERLPPRPLWRARAGRRGAGVHRDDLRVADRRGSRRAAPACRSAEHVAAWRRITDFVHAKSAAKICLQLGHSGGKGSTQLGWETMDAPLAEGNWPLIAASRRCRGARPTRRRAR